MIFVTGGSGLVGSHLIKALVAQGKKVRAIYRSTTPEFEGALNAEWVQGDVLDVISLQAALKDIDYVYHCAAIVSFNPQNRDEMLKINVEGTANVVNSCLVAGVKKLCYVSSVAALGRIREDGEIDETMNWTEKTSNSEYGKSKYLSEIEVWRGIGEGLNAVVVNPSIILGAGNWNKGSSEIFKSAYDEFPWYTGGVTGFVDVADVVKAMIQLTESNISAERFILSAEDRKYKDVFTSIANCFGKRLPHRRANRFLTGVIWRVEGLKCLLSGKEPMLTRETARTAQAVVHFNNSKLKKFVPSFEYTSLDDTIIRVCNELKALHQLK